MAAIRSSQLKTQLEYLSQLGEPGQRVLAAMPAGAVATVENASKGGWLPLELDIAMNEAVDRVLGREVLETWSRDTMRSSMEGPLLGALVSSAIAIFRLDPFSIFKFAPRAWGHILQDGGSLEWLKRTDHTSELSLREAPTILIASDAYLAALAAAFSALFDVMKVKGTVRYRVIGPRSAVFEIAWSRP